MSRALTAGELTSLRKHSQFSKLYLAVLTPEEVFACRLNGAPASNDRVVELTYDGVTTGVYTDVELDMTMYVGTSLGAYDKGMVRIRKAPTNDTLYIGETSEIAWTDNDYLTVVREWTPWQRHVRIDGTTPYMDYDVAYSDQHADFDPVPVLGSHAVVWLTGATVDVDFDASNSWVPGSTISSYAWTATGASGSSGMATATPTITYNTAGTYVVKCVVTATNGKTFTGYRYVFVYDDANQPTVDFQLLSCTGDWQAGGWQFEISMFDNATGSSIRDRAFVILFARDWYGNTEESIGALNSPDRENIICVGWIDGESIIWNSEQGSVTFTTEGPHHWIGKMSGYPVGVEDTELPTPNSSVSWTAISDLVLRKGLHHFFHWRSTIDRISDLLVENDTRQIPALEAPIGSLWSQLTQMSERVILAKPVTDRYGRIHVEIDTQYIPTGSRGSIPTVQTITTEDFQEDVFIQRDTSDKVGYLHVSGVSYTDGTATPICVRAYGQAIAHYGGVQSEAHLALVDASQAVTLAGLILGKMNNQYPLISITFAATRRVLDIAPIQQAELTVAAADTERGIGWTKNLLPRRLTLNHNPTSGFLSSVIEFEAETFNTNAIQVDCPELPTIDPVEIPGVDLPPWPPVPPKTTSTVAILRTWMHGFFISTDILTDSSPTWRTFNSGLPSSILSGNIKDFASYVDTTANIATLYAVVEHSSHAYIYRMRDVFGGSWSAKSVVIPEYPRDSYGVDTRATFFHAVGVDPTDEDNVLVAGYHLCIAGGFVTTAPPCAGATGNPCWIQNTSGIYKVSNKGAQVSARSQLQEEFDDSACPDIIEAYQPTGSFGSVSYDNSGNAVVMFTTDTVRTGGSPSTDINLHFWRTTDNGASYTEDKKTFTKPTGEARHLTHCRSGNTIYVSHRDKTYKSTDGGVSYSLDDSPTDHVYYQGPAMHSGGRVMAYKRRYTGSAWENFSFGASYDAYIKLIVNGGTADIWIAGLTASQTPQTGVRLLYSDDFGDTWSNRTGTGLPSDASPRQLLFVTI